MSTSEGGENELMSTLLPEQRKVFKELGAFLSGKLGQGATKRGKGELKEIGKTLFTDREKQAFQGAEDAFNNPLVGEAIAESLRALITALSGTAAGTPGDVTKNFLATVARPITNILNRDILPGIDRTVRGLTSRRTKIKLKAGQDTVEALSASLQQAQFQTMQLNAQIALQALGLSNQVTAQPLQQAAGFGTIAATEGGAARTEQNRLFAENNPFIDPILAFASISGGQIVQQPETLTGFGTALSGLSAIGSSVGTAGLGAGFAMNAIEQFGGPPASGPGGANPQK